MRTNRLLLALVTAFLVFFNKKYNIYIISFITGLSIYVLKYSPYADMNRTENIRAIVIYILVMVFQLILMTAMYVIKRNMRTLILISENLKVHWNLVIQG